VGYKGVAKWVGGLFFGVVGCVIYV